EFGRARLIPGPTEALGKLEHRLNVRLCNLALALLLEKQCLRTVPREQQLLVTEFVRDRKTFVDADLRERILAAKCGGCCSGMQHLTAHQRALLCPRHAERTLQAFVCLTPAIVHDPRPPQRRYK